MFCPTHRNLTVLGICEKVLKQRPYLGPEFEEDSESVSSDESFEVREGSEVGHRRRSNTALRLEKLDKQRKAQTDAQFIKVNPDETGKNDLHFERDDSYRKKEKIGALKPSFSFKKLIQSVPDPDKIPYVTYSRFESSCHPTASCKKMAVFLTVLDGNRRAYPLRVGIISSAKVEDLIGLILWQVSQKYPDVALFPPHHYKLMIADEDGEWDDDFPALDSSEPISKFSFSHLALVKLASVQVENTQRVKPSATFLLPNRTTFKLVLEDLEITMGQLVNVLLSKSGWSKHVLPPGSTNVGYHLEKHGDPNVKFLDASLPFSQCKCKDFCLVRDGSKSVQMSVKGDKFTNATKQSTERSVGRSDLYPVMVSTGRFNKLRKALCVIWSGDRIDLEFQHKTKTYPLNLISGVKFDSLKNRIVLSLSQIPTSSSASHYLSTSTQLTFTTNEHRTAMELYQHLNSILTKK